MSDTASDILGNIIFINFSMHFENKCYSFLSLYIIIKGRQLGEDGCMIILTLWMLPFFQDHIFTSIQPPNPLMPPLPNYLDIFYMLILCSYGFETISTIICFTLLEKSGVPISENIYVAVNFRSLPSIFFQATGSVFYLLVLLATFCY